MGFLKYGIIVRKFFFIIFNFLKVFEVEVFDEINVFIKRFKKEGWVRIGFFYIFLFRKV